nr:HEPN domain-containing protein [uncultured Flavobacterium sp.]
MKFAILIHLLDWGHEEKEYILDKGLTFVRLKSHPVKRLYKKICKVDRVDEGDPYAYDTALVLFDDTEEDHSFLPTASKYSLSTTFLNLLTIIHKGTLGQCRVIASKDNFKTSHCTYMLYESPTEFMDDLVVFHSKFDKQNIQILKLIWENLKATYAKDIQNSRIENALSFFYLSWNTLTLEQTGICLSIVLETLFVPHSNNELIHQISYNVAKFSSSDKHERRDFYKYIKKYYSTRSKLVHGETISHDELESIPLFFRFMCDLLLKIISDPILINTFNDNRLRKEFLENQMFE